MTILRSLPRLGSCGGYREARKLGCTWAGPHRTDFKQMLAFDRHNFTHRSSPPMQNAWRRRLLHASAANASRVDTA